MSSIIFDLSQGKKTDLKKWTFRDIKVDLENNLNNRGIQSSTDYIAIQNSINNMFLFDRGERIIQPDFGLNLRQFLYEPINDLTSKKIVSYIVDNFQKWEPRVEILGISVTPEPELSTYNIIVQYSVPSLGDNIIEFKTGINQRV